MFDLLPESSGNLICLKVSGKLTDADYKAFTPKIEAAMAEFGSLKFYIDMLDLDGWEWRAGWDDFAFGIKHWNDFSKIALVGDHQWESLAAKVADKLVNADVKYFTGPHAVDALKWVKS